MRHTRAEIIKRTVREFEILDRLVSQLTNEDWNQLLFRSESKDPWTIKDTLAHITHWKADTIRKIKKQPVPIEEKGLNWTDGNRLVYERWRDRSPQEVLAWHRKVQEDALTTLKATPTEWFNARERDPEWPYDLDGHSSDHRVKDIERALKKENTIGGMTMNNQRVYAMKFADVYPLYVQKAERKNRTKKEVDQIICWLTGYTQAELQKQIKQGNDFETFFAQAPAMNPNCSLIQGVVCGVRVEDIQEPLMQKIRYLDKLIDELAKGKAIDKILR